MRILDEIRKERNNKFTIFHDRNLYIKNKYRYTFGNYGLIKHFVQITDYKTRLNISKKFNGRLILDECIYFRTEKDAQACCDYLNEVYLPAIKLMGE